MNTSLGKHSCSYTYIYISLTEALSSSTTSNQWRAICRVKCTPISAPWAHCCLTWQVGSKWSGLTSWKVLRWGLHLTSLSTLHRSLVILEGPTGWWIYINIHHHSLMTKAQDEKHWTLNLNQTDMDGCQENLLTFGHCESFKVYTNHEYLHSK